MSKASFIRPTPDDNSVANSKNNRKKRLKKSKNMKAQLLKSGLKKKVSVFLFLFIILHSLRLKVILTNLFFITEEKEEEKIIDINLLR